MVAHSTVCDSKERAVRAAVGLAADKLHLEQTLNTVAQEASVNGQHKALHSSMHRPPITQPVSATCLLYLATAPPHTCSQVSGGK